MNMAREADLKNKASDAIRLYEQLVAAGESELIDLLNLIVLYFRCMDIGFSATHQIGVEIEAISSSRALELVAIAEEKFGESDELLYWKSMIPYHGWGEPVPPWNLRGDSLVPYLFLAREFPNAENLARVRELMREVASMEESERKRYLIGNSRLVLS